MTKLNIDFNKVADLYNYYVKTDFDIPFFLEKTRHYDKDILELMCGTGRVSIPLLEAGRKMVCIDYAKEMLKVFKESIRSKALNCSIILMDVTQLSFRTGFGLIILPFHSFSEIISLEQQLKALKSISEHLVDDGKVIMTLQNPASRLKQADGKLKYLGKFNIDGDKSMAISYMNEYDITNGIVSGYQLYEIYNSENKLMETRRLDIKFRPINYAELIRLVKDAGLKISNIYGDYQLSPFDESESHFIITELMKV